MIGFLIITTTLSVKQPSCPPPPPPPERIVAVISKEIELVTEKNEQHLGKTKKNTPSSPLRNMGKTLRAKRQHINRRGVRNK